MKAEIKCILIAKKTKTLEEMTAFLSKQEAYQIKTFTNSFAEFSKIIVNKDVDVVFMETDSIENQYLEFLNVLSERPISIVISNKEKIAAECYRMQIDDFLLKPLSKQQLEQCIQKINHELKKKKILAIHKIDETDISRESDISYQSSKYIFINSYKCSVRININDIISIERIENVTLFFMEKNESIPVQSRLAAILTMLPAHRFARINRSQIICLDKVRFVKGNNVTLYHQEFTISRNYIRILRKIRNNMKEI